MYVLVQEAVPKYNSAHCQSYKHVLFLPVISIVNLNILIHIYMLLCNYAAVYVHFIYTNTMHCSSV